jgi:dihydropteroate synthase
MMIWRIQGFDLAFPRPSMVMGILNVTPDSFSDGGLYFSTESALSHARQLIAEGAEILDIGGESSRPFAEPVSEGEELRRVIPVIERLKGGVKTLISIDTQKPSVAREAIKAGAAIVNDIAARRSDEDMARLAAESGAGYVLMHSLGAPQTMQINPTYENVVREVGEFFEKRMDWLERRGVQREQIVLDVGIGFGKTVEHNLQLLSALGRFQSLGRPMLLGVSRKSFIGKMFQADIGSRLPGAIACAVWAVQHGHHIVRTHDVGATLQALRMTEALQDGQT